MSLLVVGISHHSAPLDLLERCALDAEAAAGLASRLQSGANVREVVVLATCNRLEIYADITAFHAGLAQIVAGLVEVTEVPLATLADHLFVQHGEPAVRHLFTVACGMDSMALGESQILGQVRDALRTAQRLGTVSRTLASLVQQALRVGKRAFSETGLAQTGHSLVEQALSHVEELGIGLPQATCLVIGAGSMSGLAVASLRRLGAGTITVANRSVERARRLAQSVDGNWVSLSDRADLTRALAGADVVVTCTGARGLVLDAATVAAALTSRQQDRDAAGMLIVDLALPRDVDPAVVDLPSVTVVGLAELSSELAELSVGTDLDEVRAIIDSEVAGYLQAQRAEEVAPTVVALRAYAEDVLRTELERLMSRVQVDARAAAEIERTIHRVVDKLLHRPTVRVKSLSAQADGLRYAEALRQLFDLDIDEITGAPAITDVGEVLAATLDLAVLLETGATDSIGAGAGPGGHG